MQLEFVHLTHRYDRVMAIDDLTERLSGQVIGLLGHNASGKSTLIGVLTGAIAPTSGVARIDGQPVGSVRRTGSYQQELPSYFPVWQTLRETLENSLILARVARREQMAGELLELVDLSWAADRPVATFSGGMKQKLRIAQMLVHRPERLILDEPTAGLDVQERLNVIRLLGRLSSRLSVVFSTHQADDAAGICDVVLILERGRRLGTGSPHEIAAVATGKVWELRLGAGAKLNGDYMPIKLHRTREGLRVRAVGHFPPEGATPVEPTLEDGYAYLRYLSSEPG